MTDQRSFLRAIFDAAVAAAHPDVVLSAHLRPVPKGRIICVAAGKGAAAMAAAAERHYLDALEMDPERLSGIATTRHGHGVPTRRIKVIEAGHPVPDEAGLQGAEQSLQLAQGAGNDDLLLVLLSGGGSANWIAPADGVSFAQKQLLTRALLRSGAPKCRPRSSRWRSRTFRATIRPRSRRDRRCRIRPRLRMRAPSSRNMAS